MPNSLSQMIPDKLDWRQIWRSGKPRKGSNKQCGDSLVTPLPCEAKHCHVEIWPLGAGAYVATHVVSGCHGHAAGLSWGPGSILEVTVYCRR
ncbi:hypothetical protein TNCV_2276011 [Trichonephila clavipes]|nr:hypothetical protein TNCV_2276011 [Trichonephila clavipes]